MARDAVPDDSPASAAASELPDVFPNSMKGYTLYGYVKDGSTYFTLVTGTNLAKTFDELDAEEPIIRDDGWVCVRVAGTERAADLLRRIARDEDVFVTTVRHVSVAQSTVPDDVGVPDDAVLAALQPVR
jgi:hypothetical protein